MCHTTLDLLHTSKHTFALEERRIMNKPTIGLRVIQRGSRNGLQRSLLRRLETQRLLSAASRTGNGSTPKTRQSKLLGGSLLRSSRCPWQRRLFHKSSARYEEEAAASVAEAPKQYSTPELTEDAAKHKAGLNDPDKPYFHNPLHHNNPNNEKMFREDFDTEEEFQAAINPAPPLDLGDGTTPAPEYLHAIADEIVHLSMLEMNELVNKIADHYGFHEGMLSPDGDADGGEGDDGDEDDADAPKAEAKTSFDLKLIEFDAKAKLKIIKEVRALAGLGLKEAKELVENAPTVIHKDLKQEEAEELKAKLEELGGKVEIV